MKKIIVIFVLSLSFTGLFAQDAVSFKNAGNAALKAKDYKTALENFEKFMQAPDTFDDQAVVYNTAYSAIKIGKYDKAVEYFDVSIKNNYKTDVSYQYKALAFKKIKKTDLMMDVQRSCGLVQEEESGFLS